MELISQILHRVRQLEADDLLCKVGLQKRRSGAARIAPILGALAGGLVVGAGLGLLFAPSSGRELRSTIGTRAADLKDRGVAAVKRTASRANGAEDQLLEPIV